jgi:hypothetical protein
MGAYQCRVELGPGTVFSRATDLFQQAPHFAFERATRNVRLIVARFAENELVGTADRKPCVAPANVHAGNRCDGAAENELGL